MSDLATRSRPTDEPVASTPAPVIWPVPVPICNGRDRLALGLLTAIMLVPAALLGLASADGVTG